MLSSLNGMTPRSRWQAASDKVDCKHVRSINPGCTTIPTSSSAKPGVPVQVRLWNVVRSQQEILGSMRDPSGVEAHPGLVAYWKFDDADR